MPIIEVTNLSKRYRIGLKEKRADTFAGQLANVLRAPLDNFRRLRNLSKFGGEDESVFWALRDINFTVEEGEVLGIIGHNGAGKSTLLKILSRITEPTSGQVRLRGRVSSLLEVGTGFHPDLTGRENVYMNGTILGMTRREIDRKFDEIVDFSGVEKYIDTPVKRYSSGMTVRLAFSVAAHLEPEILIIDEVLAVGDAEFQKKCLGKMKDVSGQGRTILFVSHNLAALKSLCNSGIVLQNGMKKFEGGIFESVSFYTHIRKANVPKDSSFENDNIRILQFGLEKETHFISDSILFYLNFFNKTRGKSIDVTLGIRNQEDLVVFYSRKILTDNKDSIPGIFETIVEIPGNFLNSGTYQIILIFGENQSHSLFTINELLEFEILNEAYGNTIENYPGIVRPILNWKASFTPEILKV